MKSRIWRHLVVAAALALGPAAWAGDENESLDAVEANDADEGSASADAVFEFLVAEIAAQAAAKVARHGPTQVSVAHDDIADALPHHMGQEAAPRRLHLRELRHRDR